MNIYEQANKAYFDELKSLVEHNLKTYPKTLQTTRKYLLDWINSILPALQDGQYTLSVKIYWILNGLIDFPKCMHCGKPIKTKKIKLHKGYGKFCSNYCMTHSEYRANKRKQTCLQKYGVDHYSKTDEFKTQFVNTCTERYGGTPFSKASSVYEHLFDKLSEREGRKITNPSQIREIAEKAKQTKLKRYGENCFDIEKQKETCLERYGVDHYSKTDEFKEKYKTTCLDKYGVENIFQTDSAKEKSKQTCLERYGVEYYQQTDMFAKQCQQTCLEKYGVKSYLQSDDFKKQFIQVCLEKYGVEYPMQSEEIREKSRSSMLKTYGVEYAMQSDRIREKSKLACMEKYGVENPMQSEEVQERFRQTCLSRFGVEHPSQCREIRLKAQARYEYEGISFDSAPELAFYIWLNDTGADFEYQPDTCFWYEYGGEKHRYFPDFRVNNTFIEIKGDHFLTESGKWQCPWDHSLDSQYETKRQCAVTNDVRIMYSAEYQKYLNHVSRNHGADWISQFRRQPII